MGNILIKMKPGLRVVRGPDWTYEDQDGGEGHVGTVVEIGGHSGSQTPEKHVTVVWDSGARHQYRAGHEDAYDLRVYDSAPCGVVHVKPCSACLTPSIYGLRWTCSQCPLIHLCTGCYMTDMHDTSHPFERFETDSPLESVTKISVPSRSDSCADKIEAKGIFIGATVTRGPDWQWGNQDGGEGNQGNVVTPGRWVNVEWEMAGESKCRLGHDGKVDLKCVTETSDGFYYKNHLPILGKITEVDGLPQTHEDSWADATSSDSDDESSSDSDLILGSDTEEDDDHEDDDGADVSEDSVDTPAETYDVTNACLGLRVVRRPGWKLKNQDGGEGHVGTVVGVPGMGMLSSSEKNVTVLWDSGHQSVCRVGQKGQFDLLVFDNAQINIEHKGITCDGCQNNPLQGIRWKCTVCADFDLCSKCYGSDVHDLGHSFWRFEKRSEKIPYRVPKRLYSQKVQAMGISKGAKVVRGRDWAWQEQDGGDGQKGRVIETVARKDGVTRGWTSVEWTNGFKNIYRLGKGGKLDLKCVKATAAGFYYRDHLPVLGRLDVKPSPYNVGDKVRCKVDTETLKHTQDGRSSETVAQYVKQVGTVCNICYDGQIKVCYEDGSKFTYHHDTLMKFWLNSSDVTAFLHERRVQRCNDGTSVDPPIAESPDCKGPVLGERTMCAVCAMKESQTAFVPCGHLICCPDCAVVQGNCPICTAEIEQLLLTFIS